jgi:hypothetical protein
MSSNDLGFTMFPDQIVRYEMSLTFSKADFDRARSLMPKDIVPWFSPVIFGCINYRLTFAAEKHQTWFCYRVSRLQSGTHYAIREEDGEIPIDQLSLDPESLVGGCFRAD